MTSTVADGLPKAIDDSKLEPDDHLLEYYAFDEESDQLVYHTPTKPKPQPSEMSRSMSLSASTGSSVSSSSSTYSSDVARSNSLRTSPRSPRGSAHRRLAIVGMGGESALVIPSDVAAELQSRSNLKTAFSAAATSPASRSRQRPTSTPLKLEAVAMSLATRAPHAHSRSASDSTTMQPATRQASDSSVYDDDDSTEPDLDPPPLVKRSSLSDHSHSSQSPTSNSKGSRRISPVEPSTPGAADANMHLKDAGPIVVGLGLKDLVWSPEIREEYISHRPQQPLLHGPSYLDYQPGVHSLAGPPPRRGHSPGAAGTPPPRPTRLEFSQPSPVPKFHARNTSTVTPELFVDSPDAAEDDADFVVVPRAQDSLTVSSPEQDGTDDAPASVRSFHSREGAFPPSRIMQSHQHETRSRPPVTSATFETLEEMVAQATAQDEASSTKSRHSPAPPPSAFSHPIKRDKSLPRIVHDLSENSDSPPPPGERTLRDIRRLSDLSRSSSERLSHRSTPTSKHLSLDMHVRQTPSPISHSGSSRDDLPEIPQHERLYAMPRTPSSLSMTSGIDHIATYDSTKTPTGKRRRSPPGVTPPSMLFQDILRGKSALERGSNYARKFGELMGESSGLEDWVQFMKLRHKPTVPTNRSSVRISIRPVRPPGAPAGQPRHVSNASISSEATFPIRPDAYHAHDLSPHEGTDLSPPTGLPALPYPGISQSVAVRPSKPGFSPASSLRSIASNPSAAVRPNAGFFATISRKASLTKKPSGPPLPLAPQPSVANRLLSRRGTQALPQVRPVKISATPALRGGPRPLGQRVMRANTVGGDAFAAVRQAAASPTEISQSPTEAFTRSLNGMSDVLPDVDREVLAVYLQQAEGKEINAISAYLADQRAS